MSPFEIAWLTIFILILFAGVFSVIFSLPGTILIVADVIIYSWVTGFEKIGFKIIIILVFISLLAETLDFLLGASGARRFGPSKKGVIASLIGGITGAVVLTPLLMGPGIIIGMFFGGFAGALFVEYFNEKKLKPAFRTGYRPLLLRNSGVLLKGFFAIVMTIITLSSIYS